MRDPVYMSLLAFTLIFGVWAALVEPAVTILIVVAYALSPLAVSGLGDYQHVFGEMTGISGENKPRYEFAMLGVIPAILANVASWSSLATGAILAVVVAVSEETFRAGAYTLLRRQMYFPPVVALLTANGAWLMYHFAQRPFDLMYAVWLAICAIVFSAVLVKGGLGAACLAHVLTNSMAQWISLAAYGSGEQGITVGALALVVLVVFAISMIGGMGKWKK